MPPRIAAARVHPVEPDPTVAAMDRQTDVIESLVARLGPLTDLADALVAKDEEGNTVVERFAKAADELRDLGGAQKKLCAFILNNRLKIMGVVIAVGVGVGAVSPNAATAIGGILKAMGAP